MRILYLGDVMASPGLELIERALPGLRRELKVDVVIVQAENVSDGKGVTQQDFARLKKAGVDFCTGGNHTFAKPEINALLSDPNQPIIRPANYPDVPGLGYKFLSTSKGSILVISILGQIVGKDADKLLNNPLQTMDAILQATSGEPHVATVVNFHGDFSSEKVVFGHYLDGKVSMVVGDHWHVPTADARVLPGGTAHMTDVGMCGVLNSSLGVTFESILPRWHDGLVTRNVVATEPPFQLNGLLTDIDTKTGLATSAQAIRRIYKD
ncbi:MAG TPA: TIGR00282 family metallophosphoesterase [Candidatus Saccharimonadales bacterium]|nr:TIGR00282 family metallophosphoesterase [Candidatus Saccharimonadales bacterium]